MSMPQGKQTPATPIEELFIRVEENHSPRSSDKLRRAVPQRDVEQQQRCGKSELWASKRGAGL